MQQIAFTKMNGAGNDFVVIDNRQQKYQLSTAQIAQLCHRQRGIGADGLLAVECSDVADFKFRYYNADGGEADMCGNGARCFAAFIYQQLQHPKPQFTLETQAGNLTANVHADGQVTIAMSTPKDLALHVKPKATDWKEEVHFLHTGVEHVVAFCNDINAVDILKIGKQLRFSPSFEPAGANANFVEIIAPGKLKVRTYERGVENETLACGTGITACALIYAILQQYNAAVEVTSAGGDQLTIAFQQQDTQQFTDVTMQGPATFVFTGNITL